MNNRNLNKTKFILIIFSLSTLLNSSQSALGFNYPKKLTTLFSLLKTKDEEKNIHIGFMSIEGTVPKAKIIIKKLREIAKNQQIKGLIIHMESSGGPVGTSQLIFSELKKLKKIKPVIVIIENACCSGAYLIATAADFIFAMPGSEVGSIGVKRTIEKYKDLKFKGNQHSGNMDVLVFTAGKYKDLSNPYTPSLKEHAEYFKQINQKLYDQFVADVAQSRKISIEDQTIWADGKAFTGIDALQLGLIDALGDFSDTLIKMQELLEQKGFKIKSDLEILEIKIGTN